MHAAETASDEKLRAISAVVVSEWMCLRYKHPPVQASSGMVDQFNAQETSLSVLEGGNSVVPVDEATMDTPQKMVVLL